MVVPVVVNARFVKRVPRVRRLSASVALLLCSALVAGCGGGARSVAPRPAPTSTTAADYNGPLADATFKITIPVPTTSAKARRPAYVSSSTTKIVFTLNSDTVGLTGAALTTFNTTNLGAKAVTLNSATCPGTGPWTCTLTIKLPPGTDNLTISAQDGSSNVLSQQVQNFTVVAGIANSFTTTLDANAATMTLTGTQACQIGTVGAAYGSVGTTPVTFTVSYTDLAGKTIVTPGLPKLEIQDGSAVYQAASGTIGSGNPGVSFTINQSNQTFTITPNSTSSSQTINVKAIQADSNVPIDTNPDGLSFARTKSYTFSTGVAPPAHNFLGTIEQLTLASGQVDFFNVTLGGNTAGSDTFAAFGAAPTLAVTASSNQPTVNDVDNPSDLRWDTNGDLLIANGGGAPGDNGNMACVPVGAIATGANTSTTVTANVDAPVSIAYDTRDGSVALANNPTSSPVQLAEYALTGNYTASSNNLTASGFGSLGSVTEMPSLTKGTYAISLATGAEEDPGHVGTTGTNKVTIFSPTGVSTNLTDDTTFSIDEPWGLAWDAAHSQLVIANHSTWHRLLSFYSDTGTKIKTVDTTHRNSVVAASADGHVAVAWTTSFGYMQVQVYANASGATAPTPVSGPIPYNGMTGPGCTGTYIYGNGTTIVNSLKWLSNTKLLVAVQSNNSGTPTAKNGFYVYDITNSEVPTGFDDITCAGFASAPINTGFVHVNNKPLGAAFKP